MILKADRNQFEYNILSTKLYSIYLFICYMNIQIVSYNQMTTRTNVYTLQPVVKCIQTLRPDTHALYSDVVYDVLGTAYDIVRSYKSIERGSWMWSYQFLSEVETK